MEKFLGCIELKSGRTYRLIEAENEDKALEKLEHYVYEQAMDPIDGFLWEERPTYIIPTIK